MAEEFFEWLKENNCDLSILSQKHRLPAKAVLEAAEVIFDRVKQGEIIKPISVAWRIRGLAQTIQGGWDHPHVSAFREQKLKEKQELEMLKVVHKNPVPLWLKIITLWWMR